ncbi:MAG: arylesterase, partial [Croceibacterium sp.]
MRRFQAVLIAALTLAACRNEPAARQQPELAAIAKASSKTVAGPERRILAFGDSLFAGYRLSEGEGYPERLEAKLRSQGINARVSNAGVSGDTTAAGRQRLKFVLDSLGAPPELAVVELGGNDLLRGVPPAETRANLAAILAELHARKIPILLMGMRAPPNMGPKYQAEFDLIYPALAQQFGARLVPFFQAAVFDRPALLQADHVH